MDRVNKINKFACYNISSQQFFVITNSVWYICLPYCLVGLLLKMLIMQALLAICYLYKLFWPFTCVVWFGKDPYKTSHFLLVQKWYKSKNLIIQEDFCDQLQLQIQKKKKYFDLDFLKGKCTTLENEISVWWSLINLDICNWNRISKKLKQTNCEWTSFIGSSLFRLGFIFSLILVYIVPFSLAWVAIEATSYVVSSG